MEGGRTSRRWTSGQALNASTSSLQELASSSNSAAPAVRWERRWGNARTFPAPPSHAIGNTPGIKVASTKAQFLKWTAIPDKDPVDFSEDDQYIAEASENEMDLDKEEINANKSAKDVEELKKNLGLIN
ncbi:hypothetical protein HK100_000504 [Physocladia obscura]|uniref:Uncharacterized protein n=1 Tax=Physocladia obscura TaxID=109957 RepID=A0AAD5T7W8_9FUNG|nr:hypothetical protein HK100_000504 [Physocladia obscura]